jgi:RimJ/RimL family protein N-acetyltransferase
MRDIEHFATERLLAERLSQAHLADLRRLWQDPRVMVHSALRSDEETRARLRKSAAHWEAHGFGRWIVHNKSTGELVGQCNLRHIILKGTPEVDMGYAVIPELWRQGFAAEMANAVIKLAFGQIGLGSVIALARPANLPSIGVMNKAGMRFEREALFQTSSSSSIASFASEAPVPPGHPSPPTCREPPVTAFHAGGRLRTRQSLQPR